MNDIFSKKKGASPVSVSIGIPAHNEEANIAHLLDSILSQKIEKSFCLEKILVIIDGSSDRTEEIVREYGKKNSLIEALCDGHRKGKNGRLNDLYAANESEILVTLDGDITFETETGLQALLTPFGDPEVAVVSGNEQLFTPETLFEKIFYARNAWWYEARKDWNGGNNIHNSAGCIFALRKDFSKHFTYLPGTLHDHDILYFQTIEQKKKFVFANEARVLFRDAATWKEVVERSRRHAHRDDLSRYNFHFDPEKLPTMPLSRKLRAIATVFPHMPLPVVGSLFLVLALKVAASKKEDPLYAKGLWKITESSKKLV